MSLIFLCFLPVTDILGRWNSFKRTWDNFKPRVTREMQSFIQPCFQAWKRALLQQQRLVPIFLSVTCANLKVFQANIRIESLGSENQETQEEKKKKKRKEITGVGNFGTWTPLNEVSGDKLRFFPSWRFHFSKTQTKYFHKSEWNSLTWIRWDLIFIYLSHDSFILIPFIINLLRLILIIYFY